MQPTHEGGKTNKLATRDTCLAWKYSKEQMTIILDCGKSSTWEIKWRHRTSVGTEGNVGTTSLLAETKGN